MSKLYDDARDINPKRIVLCSLNAKNRAEVFRVMITRRRFTERVVQDSRTREVFTRWRRESKLDLVVTEWSAQLDVAAARAGVAHRSLLTRDQATYDALPLVTREFFSSCDRVLTLRRENTAEARAADVLRFIDTVLYTTPPRLRGWLALALMDDFDAELVRDVWGEPDVSNVGLTGGPFSAVPLTEGYTPNVDLLERGADWYFDCEVASSKTTHAEVARAYAASRAAEGVTLAEKDQAGILERPDTKLVRDRIADANRLLNTLAVKPEDALRFLKTHQKHS
jgi:hypothetical protein